MRFKSKMLSFLDILGERHCIASCS